MKKKILHLLGGLSRGGCEGNALCMILESPGYEHHLVVIGQEGEMSVDFASAGAIIHYLRDPSSFPWTLSSQIRQFVEPLNVDGMICWHGMVMLPQILHALRGCRYKVLVHGGNPAHSLPWAVDWRYWVVEKLLGRRAPATYVCCSRHVAESFDGSHYLKPFPRVVVANGVKAPGAFLRDTGTFSMKKTQVLGMVARLDAIKDHETLLRAFSVVVKASPSARLELVGDGFLRNKLELLAEEVGITGKLCFHGHVAEPYSVMSKWDLFVYATTEREGLGNALAEAMMLGLPCVATDIGPVAEVAGSPPAVRLVAPHDPEQLSEAILELLPDSSHLEALALMGRERAEKEFSAQVFADRYLQLLSL